jgi:hypothetical protein
MYKTRWSFCSQNDAFCSSGISIQSCKSESSRGLCHVERRRQAFCAMQNISDGARQHQSTTAFNQPTPSLNHFILNHHHVFRVESRWHHVGFTRAPIEHQSQFYSIVLGRARASGASISELQNAQWHFNWLQKANDFHRRYNRYLAVAARVVRRSLKEEQRVAAGRRGEMDLRFAKWEVCVPSREFFQVHG